MHYTNPSEGKQQFSHFRELIISSLSSSMIVYMGLSPFLSLFSVEAENEGGRSDKDIGTATFSHLASLPLGYFLPLLSRVLYLHSQTSTQSEGAWARDEKKTWQDEMSSCRRERDGIYLRPTTRLFGVDGMPSLSAMQGEWE